jgi:hypothetical protein
MLTRRWLPCKLLHIHGKHSPSETRMIVINEHNYAINACLKHWPVSSKGSLTRTGTCLINVPLRILIIWIVIVIVQDNEIRYLSVWLGFKPVIILRRWFDLFGLNDVNFNYVTVSDDFSTFLPGSPLSASSRNSREWRSHAPSGRAHGSDGTYEIEKYEWVSMERK